MSILSSQWSIFYSGPDDIRTRAGIIDLICVMSDHNRSADRRLQVSHPPCGGIGENAPVRADLAALASWVAKALRRHVILGVMSVSRWYREWQALCFLRRKDCVVAVALAAVIETRLRHQIYDSLQRPASRT